MRFLTFKLSVKADDIKTSILRTFSVAVKQELTGTQMAATMMALEIAITHADITDIEKEFLFGMVSGIVDGITLTMIKTETFLTSPEEVNDISLDTPPMESRLTFYWPGSRKVFAETPNMQKMKKDFGEFLHE